MGDPCPQAAATRRSLSRVAWRCLRPAAIISYATTPRISKLRKARIHRAESFGHAATTLGLLQLLEETRVNLAYRMTPDRFERPQAEESQKRRMLIVERSKNSEKLLDLRWGGRTSSQ